MFNLFKKKNLHTEYVSPREWRRFELTTNDPRQIRELDRLLDRLKLTRYELALIVISLRARPEFELKDFDI